MGAIYNLGSIVRALGDLTSVVQLTQLGVVSMIGSIKCFRAMLICLVQSTLRGFICGCWLTHTSGALYQFSVQSFFRGCCNASWFSSDCRADYPRRFSRPGLGVCVLLDSVVQAGVVSGLGSM